MAAYEQDRVQRILKDHAEADRLSQKLVFFPQEGRIRAVNSNDPDGSNLNISGQQRVFSGGGKRHDRNSL
jgi:hypothetical protein